MLKDTKLCQMNKCYCNNFTLGYKGAEPWAKPQREFRSTTVGF